VLIGGAVASFGSERIDFRFEPPAPSTVAWMDPEFERRIGDILAYPNVKSISKERNYEK
jgi:hypothetical protein